MADDLSEGHPASDEARALVGKSIGDIVYEIIASPVELVGTSHATSASAGALTVSGTISQVLPAITSSVNISARANINTRGYVVRPSIFVPARELSAGEWAGLAVLVEGIAEIAVRDHGVTATQALGVRIIAFIVLAALISRFPRAI